jgi:hypothetical protein
MVRIPKTFSLMNRDYNVDRATEDEQEDMDEVPGGLLGLCDLDGSRIILGKHRTREAYEHTYFHELAHALLEAVGKPKLSGDEALVDALGAALHQYEKTKAGTLPMRKRSEREIGGVLRARAEARASRGRDQRLPSNARICETRCGTKAAVRKR